MQLEISAAMLGQLAYETIRLESALLPGDVIPTLPEWQAASACMRGIFTRAAAHLAGVIIERIYGHLDQIGGEATQREWLLHALVDNREEILQLLWSENRLLKEMVVEDLRGAYAAPPPTVDPDHQEPVELMPEPPPPAAGDAPPGYVPDHMPSPDDEGMTPD